jgi:hypothetical protein
MLRAEEITAPGFYWVFEHRVRPFVAHVKHDLGNRLVAVYPGYEDEWPMSELDRCRFIGPLEVPTFRTYEG